VNRSPPGSFRSFLILMELGFRRWINRYSLLGRFSAFGGKAKGRRAAAGKRRGIPWLMLVFAPMFVFLGVYYSTRIIANLSVGVQRRVIAAQGRIPISRHLYRLLVEDEKFLLAALKDGSKFLRYSFEFEIKRMNDLGTGKSLTVEDLLRVFREKGSKGFAPAPDYPFVLLPSPSLRPEGELSYLVVRGLSVVAFLLFFYAFFVSLGARNREFGKMEWPLVWIFTMPVLPRIIFLGEIVSGTLANGLVWCLCVPFFFAVCLYAGYGAGALPLGLLCGLGFGGACAAATTVAETGLRRAFRPARLRNLQAIFSVAALLAFLLLMLLIFTLSPPPYFLRFLEKAPWEKILLPFVFPLILCWESIPPAAAACLTLLWVAGVVALGVWSAERFVRRGLVFETGWRAGRRQESKAKRGRWGLPFGIAAREMRLLLRDRMLLVQSLVLPLFIVGMQLMINPAILKAVTRDDRNLATLAYAVGAYTLLTSAFFILAREGKALWILYTLPERLDVILRRKTLFWASVTAVFPVLIIGFYLLRTSSFGGMTLLYAALAVLGIFPCAFIASGLGVMATDTFAVEQSRRIGPAFVHIYMLLGASYTYSFYAPDIWRSFVVLVEFSWLAYAIWHQARNRLPFLLDPEAKPKPRLVPAHGVILVFAFFILNGIATALFLTGGEPLEAGVFGYLTAAVIVTLVSLCVFWKQKIPDIRGLLGLRWSGVSWARGVGTGLVLGGAAGALGAAYLFVVERIAPLRDIKLFMLDLREELGGREPGFLLVLLLVAAAPLFEEFLFRGILFSSLRGSMGAAVAIVTSALIFAVAHPLLSVPPVFVMGILAAAGFARTGILLTPFLIHAVYNAVVLLLGPSS